MMTHNEVDIDLPGFEKDELSLELKDVHLVISAAKGLDKDEKEKKQEDIHAKYESGVLKLSIPKEEEASCIL